MLENTQITKLFQRTYIFTKVTLGLIENENKKFNVRNFFIENKLLEYDDL